MADLIDFPGMRNDSAAPLSLVEMAADILAKCRSGEITHLVGVALCNDGANISFKSLPEGDEKPLTIMGALDACKHDVLFNYIER